MFTYKNKSVFIPSLGHLRIIIFFSGIRLCSCGKFSCVRITRKIFSEVRYEPSIFFLDFYGFLYSSKCYFFKVLFFCNFILSRMSEVIFGIFKGEGFFNPRERVEGFFGIPTFFLNSIFFFDLRLYVLNLTLKYLL